MAIEPRLAAVVVLLRENVTEGQALEVFMVRRVVQSEFMPDVYVFPGGSLSPGDRDIERRSDLCHPVVPGLADPEQRTALGSGLRAAAIRELFEEANVLLAYQEGALLSIDEAMTARFVDYRQQFNARRGSLIAMAEQEHLVYATDRLAYFAHWITPEGMPKRFDTHFFLAQAPNAQEAAFDQLETSAGLWIAPSVALTRFRQGEFPLAFPTLHQLNELAGFHDVCTALTTCETRVVKTHQPMVREQAGQTRIYLSDDPDHVWDV